MSVDATEPNKPLAADIRAKCRAPGERCRAPKRIMGKEEEKCLNLDPDELTDASSYRQHCTDASVSSLSL